MQFEMDNSFKDITNIKVIGVGGGGGTLSTVWSKCRLTALSLLP